MSVIYVVSMWSELTDTGERFRSRPALSVSTSSPPSHLHSAPRLKGSIYSVGNLYDLKAVYVQLQSWESVGVVSIFLHAVPW